MVDGLIVFGKAMHDETSMMSHEPLILKRAGHLEF